MAYTCNVVNNSDRRKEGNKCRRCTYVVIGVAQFNAATQGLMPQAPFIFFPTTAHVLIGP